MELADILNDIECRLNAMESNATAIVQYLNNLERLNKQLEVLTNSIRYFEDFTDEELQGWYVKSELPLKQIRDSMVSKFPDKKGMSLQMCSNYINGKVQDVRMRSYIGRMLRDAAINKDAEKDRQNNQQN